MEEVGRYASALSMSFPVTVDAEISLDQHYSIPSDGQIELLQYRVDYVIPSSTKVPPFYAATIEAAVAPGETTGFTVTVSGSVQAAWMNQQFAENEVATDATLTVAGYDPHDEPFQADATFALVFGDFGSSSDTGQ